jgi:cysteine-rich repeat protein
MSRLRPLFAVVGLTGAPACFVDPGGEDPDTTGAAADASETSGDAATSAVDPTTGGEPPPRCGDAIQDPDEQCDLGELNNGVGGSFCRADCTTNLCGDAYVASNEACDDGNIKPGDGCSASCTLESCGDGVASGAEQCDDGNMVDGDDCTNLCKLPLCGDGIVHAGVEQCDDGNMVDGDGCTGQCVVELCGDGKLDPGEQCDDGDLEGLDGCSPVCVQDAHRVFVTSQRYTGDFGGLAGADQICQMLARAAGLTGQYKAWLSDAEQSPAARFDLSPLPYVRTDGALIAAGWEDLIDSMINSPINVDEYGVAIVTEGCQPENLAWTNTRFNGTVQGDLHCFNWQVGVVDGRAGELNALGTGWTNGCTVACTSQLHLYCFEQGL